MPPLRAFSHTPPPPWLDGRMAGPYLNPSPNPNPNPNPYLGRTG